MFIICSTSTVYVSFSVDSDDQKKEESIYQLALHLVTCYNYDEKVRFLLY